MPADKIPNVLLLGATFDTQNMGVGALAAGSLRCLTTKGRRVSISLLDYGTEETVETVDEHGARVPIPVVAMRFSKKLYLPNNIVVLLALAALCRLLPAFGLRDWITSRNSCLRQICAADLVAAISGGDSFSDIYGLARFFYVVLPLVLTVLLGTRLVLLPQTLGPFYGRLPRIVAKWIITHAAQVYSRDHQGIEDLKSLLGRNYNPKRHLFCYDVGFVVEPRKPSHAEVAGISFNLKRSAPLVGLNVSGLLLAGGYTQDNMFGLRVDYRRLIYSIIDDLIYRKEATVLLVPHVFGTTPGSESDVLACEEVFHELSRRYDGRLGIVRGEFDQSEIKYVIGQCDFFVGSRMHACIAALSQQIPAVTVAYSKKFLGVLNTIGIPSLVADARTLNEDQIVGVINTAFDDRHQIADYLSRRMPVVKQAVAKLSDSVLQVGTETSPDAIDRLPERAFSSIR